MTANQSFYVSIASWADSLSPKTQSLLQRQVLQLFYETAYGVEDDTI